MMGIIAFLQCLPKLIDLMTRIGNWMIANNIKDWINDLEVTVDKLEKAQTPEEKLGAAHGIVDSIRHLN